MDKFSIPTAILARTFPRFNPMVARKKSDPRGPQTNGKSPQSPFDSLKGVVDSAPTGQGVSWSVVDGAIIQDAITAVTDAGDGISFSKSSTSEVYAIALLHSGRVKKFYDRDPEAVEEYLTDVIAAYK